MNKKYEVREISLVDLMWRVFFAWKQILVCAIVFTLLAGAYAGIKYNSGVKQYNADMAKYNSAIAEAVQQAEAEAAQQAEAEEALEAKEAEEENEPLTQAELEQIQNAVFYKGLITKQENYIANSILMKVNPYREKKLLMYFYVDSDYTYNYVGENTVNPMGSIQAAYVNYVNNGPMVKNLKKNLGLDIDEQYIKECLSASTTDSSVVVSVIYNNDDYVAKIADNIQKCMEGKTKEFSATFGAHTLKLISQEQLTVMDNGLISTQINANNALNNYRAQYNNFIANMREEQLKQLGLEVKKEAEEAGEPETVTPDVAPAELAITAPVKPVFSKKIVLLGFVGGIFVMCVWVAMLMIFDNHLQHGYELSDYFDLRFISVIRDKKTYTGVDKLLMNLKTRNQKKISYEESLVLTCGNLALICKKDNITRLGITGSEVEKLEDAGKLCEMLAAEGIEAVVCNNATYDMNALKQIVDIGVVAILEADGISIYSEIDRQLEILKQNDVKVLGAVGIE